METKDRITLLRARFFSLCLLLCLSILFFTPTNPLASEHQNDVEEQEIELESIRSEIKNVQSRISSAQESVDKYMTEIESNEKSIANLSLNIDELKIKIETQLSRLDQLQIESRDQENILLHERDLLAEQIRTAYKTGRHDFVKMLLNQENPELVGRMMAYHDYYNKARADRISEVQITLNNLNQIKIAISNESEKLETFKSEQLIELSKLSGLRDVRKSSISELNSYISEQDTQLVNLQYDEQELSNLINNLKNEQDIVELYENLPPFSSLKGKLGWPVKGNLITRFGSPKREGKLKWNGVRISSEIGNDVQAVSAGKVIFADWFRNLGLLMIIDHGNGFMSLYGHNERLLKKADDFVNTGEIVAKVGNTGGQTEPALYFEIRQQGAPQNPGLWCKN